MEEVWKDIKGFEGSYQVSNLGRVKSLYRIGERVLSGRKTKYGYLDVMLYKDGKGKNYKVHRLVAEAFISNPDHLPQVNHINEDKQSNVVTNLEWCDNRYNNNYGTKNERTRNALSKPVYQYTKDGALVRSYPSTIEVQRQTGYNQGNINRCCLGKAKSAYGYLWSYELINKAYNLF